MLTKTTLTIDGREHELRPDCVKNWDDVVCCYKRSDLGSVVRKFSSSFDFVNEAYDLLLDLYHRDGVNAEATLTTYVQDDRLRMVKLFDCPIDFSTCRLERSTISLNCLDRSFASMVSSNKGVKYEMAIGATTNPDADLNPDCSLYFDRLPMIESATYKISNGTDVEGVATNCDFHASNQPYLGLVNDETLALGSMFINGDQEREYGYVLQALEDLEVSYESLVVLDPTGHSGGSFELVLKNGSQETTLALCSNRGWQFVGDYDTLEDLVEDDPEAIAAQSYAHLANGNIAIYTFNGRYNLWVDTGMSHHDYFRNEERQYVEGTITVPSGNYISVVNRYSATEAPNTPNVILYNESYLKLSWVGRGKAVEIDAFKPATVCSEILRQVVDGKYLFDVHFSGHDSRIADTLLLPAESVRALKQAKLYSSFTDFCEWMSVVFGYDYRLGDAAKPSVLSRCVEIGHIGPEYEASEGFAIYDNEPRIAGICVKYNTRLDYLVYHNVWDTTKPKGVYPFWIGYEDYGEARDGFVRPRADTVYKCGGKLYQYVGGKLVPYDHKEDEIALPTIDVYFEHRSEIFDTTAPTKVLGEVAGVSASVDGSMIYAKVSIGYDKQEYENVNGRDEFNTCVEYTTDCAVSTKELKMLSPYRADCYGIEYATQMRSQDTTDSDSDSSVFFVLAATADDGKTVPARTEGVEGTLTDQVFNAAFCPRSCVLANEGYVGIQSKNLRLRFASSCGNSEAVLGEYGGASADIELSERLMTPLVAEVETDDPEVPQYSQPFEFKYDGVRYIGFLKEFETCFSKAKPYKYKLYIKDIERC